MEESTTNAEKQEMSAFQDALAQYATLLNQTLTPKP
jgi:hypothetical protein